MVSPSYTPGVVSFRVRVRAKLALHLWRDRVAKSGSDAEVITNSIRELDRSTQMITIISLNASIEATRLGETGPAFKQIVNEISDISNQMTKIAVSLQERIEVD